jgi:hypothetical protein
MGGKDRWKDEALDHSYKQQRLKCWPETKAQGAWLLSVSSLTLPSLHPEYDILPFLAVTIAFCYYLFPENSTFFLPVLFFQLVLLLCVLDRNPSGNHNQGES